MLLILYSVALTPIVKIKFLVKLMRGEHFRHFKKIIVNFLKNYGKKIFPLI